MRLSELTDRRLVGAYKNCKKSTNICDGCPAFGVQHCKTAIKEEMCRRLVAIVEGRMHEQLH